MSCQHGEDACCQHCLEKVQTTTKKEDSPPEKTMKLRDKRILTLMFSSLLVANGAVLYFFNKTIFNKSTEIFDSILDIIGTRTEEEEE